MYKLGHCTDGEWQEHSHSPVYKVVTSQRGAEKIFATAPGSDPIVFQMLSKCMNPPLILLYVLHTPRGEAEAGRYESLGLTRTELDGFLESFSEFLRSDARFDLWVLSPADKMTIVWDRHNFIHAYGKVNLMVEALRAIGFHEGQPMIPSPHEHHFHAAFDGDARALLSHFDWYRTPLKPEDEQ